MKRIFKIIVLLSTLAGSGLWGGNAYAVTCTSIAGNGNWNAVGTWTGCAGGNGVPANTPGTNDTAIIATTSPNVITANVAVSVAALTVNAGANIAVAGFNFTVNGATNVSGTLSHTNTGGTETYVGHVTINAGGVWDNAIGESITFQGGLTHNGASFTSGTLATNGRMTFNTNNQVIDGSSAINFVRVRVQNAFTVTNNNTNVITIIGTLDGTVGGSTWVNGTNSTVNYSNVTIPMNTNGVLTATAAGNTFNYNGAAQTAEPTTYYNLTLSGSGAKTFATNPTVNNVLSMEGTATVTVTGGSGVMSYGPNATLQYNTATARTVSAEEWITPFAASGGVIIANTGVITLNVAKVFNASIPLTINPGATLATNNLQVTFGGDFVNGGTFTAGSSPIVITNTMATQSISGFTTTGLTSMTKTAGTATFTSNVNGNSLTLNGAGGTLDLGAGLTHTFTGNWTRTAGTLLGGSSTLNIGGSCSGAGGTFTAGTSTVNWNAAGAQTVCAVAYYNLGLATSGAKTMTGVTSIANNLNISGTATMTGNAAFTVGGALNYSSTGATTLTAATPISIGTYNQTAGTLTDSGNTITVTGTGANTWAKTGTFTATGTVVFTGTAPQIGASNFASLTINVGGGNTAMLTGNATPTANLTVSTGTLDLSTFTANRTVAGGTLTVSNGATLKIGGTNTIPSNYTVHTLGTTSTVEYGGTNQTVSAETYGNLTLSGSGTKTAGGSITVGSTLTLTAGTFTVGANTLTLNGPTIAGTPTNLSTTTTSNLVFGGSSVGVQAPSSVTVLNNLTVNNTNGITLNSSPALSGTLTLTNGTITTAANTLEVASNCTTAIVGGSATTYVVGNLALHYPTNAGTTTCTFPIGDAAAYTPATVAILNVTSTIANSKLTARTDTPDHADTTANLSGVDASKSVNRYWTLTPGGALTFATYNTTFTFVNPGDFDVGATTANFIIARKNTGVWTYPTMGAANPTNTTATGMTQAGGFGEFAIGERISISGTVFEDINYGGGSGRDITTSAGTVISGVRVELYNNLGNFVTSTTTNASGIYLFSSLANGNYTVRVASNGATGIRSTRAGGAACATCVPVQTYRTNAASGTAVAVTDHVGGETPTLLDAGDNTTSATLASLTTGTTTAQSITAVTKGAAGVTGVDFGFNFDAIVSIRDAGQGSLRQFITNSNALTAEGSLAQIGLIAGRETSIFMIPNGAANPGQNVGNANQLTVGGANAGAAVISLASALPVISGASTNIDATTQTTNVGDTNPGTVGTGGTVGVSAIPLPKFERPEVVIAAIATQLSGTGSPVYIKGIAVSNGGIIVSGTSSEVRDSFAGMNADGTVSTTYSANYGIIAGAGTDILISHDYVKVNNSGIRGDSPGANLIIEYSEVDSMDGTPGGGQTNTFDGILIVNSATNIIVRYNLVRNQRGGALEFGFGAGAVTGVALENTLVDSGFTSPGVPSTEGMNVAVYSLAAGTDITLQQNIISGSSRVGIAVIPGAQPTASGITMTRNSIFNNATIGIDLNPIASDPNTYTPQGVTLNDMNDADAGPNGLLNFPVLDNATISGGNLDITGWARPGSVIELFIADGGASAFGEGQTYLTTLTEGSGADTDAATSAYGPGAINGIVQGTDNTNRFHFVIALPGGVANGTVLTATATLANSTSEFSGNVVVTQFPSITLTKLVGVISDPVNLAVNPKYIPGAIAQYTILASNSGGPVDIDTTVITDPIPANTLMYLKDIGVPGSGPVLFAQGATSSTLSYTFGTIGPPLGLADPFDDLEFSNDGGATWTASPTFDATTGCDTTVPPITHIRINPKGTFVGNPIPPNPSFLLDFRVCVK